MLLLQVLLQVSGVNEVVSAALVIPFLIIAGVASVLSNAIVYKYGYTKTILLASYIVLPIGMVCGLKMLLFFDAECDMARG
jgi:uncharacterized membrane protein